VDDDRNSVDEAGWTSYATFETIAKAKGIQAPQIWEGKKGGTQTAVRELSRESYLFFGPDGSLMSVKWHNLKVILRYCEGMDQPIVTPQWPMLFDLGSDPGELYNVFADKMDMGWMLGVALKFVADYQKSIAQYPNIKTGEEFNGY
jgi:hypothetical protein